MIVCGGRYCLRIYIFGKELLSMKNPISLDTLCAALAYTIGIDAPAQAAPANETLCAYVDKMFEGRKADRIFMYNPDAIAQWIYEKYPHLMKEAIAKTELPVPFCTVMPSVTPVCFGTMYTGAQPCVHGIQKYEKPVIKIDTLFDALIRAGKKPAIVSFDPFHKFIKPHVKWRSRFKRRGLGMI